MHKPDSALDDPASYELEDLAVVQVVPLAVGELDWAGGLEAALEARAAEAGAAGVQLEDRPRPSFARAA
eukprot:16431157-Heterocapsa_arctica.AAC.1